MERKIKTKDIYVGVVKTYTDKGVEVSADSECVILLKEDGQYKNIFSLDETLNCAIFKRVPYSNTTQDGEDFGTKLVQINEYQPTNNEECLILMDFDFQNFFGKEDIDIERIYDFSLKTDFFIRQRRRYAVEKMKKLQEPVGMLKIIINDSKEEKTIAKQKKKCRCYCGDYRTK